MRRSRQRRCRRIGRRQKGQRDGGMSGGGIEPLAHRHIAHPMGREKALIVVDRSDLIPPQPGQILGDHQVDALFPDVFQQALERGAVKIGTGVSVIRIDFRHRPALLPDILPKFQAEFPMVEFSLFEGNSTHLEDELAHGRVDLIICFQPIMMEGVEVVPLTEEELILVVPKIFTDQLFGDRAEEVRAQFASGADIDVFQHQPFILIKRGNRTRNTVDQYFSRHFFKPKLILETENTITTLAMAEAGIGITICPELFLKTIHVTANQASTEKLDLFPLTDPSSISKLVVGYRRDRYLSHFGERFIQLTQQALLPPNTLPRRGSGEQVR